MPVLLGPGPSSTTKSYGTYKATYSGYEDECVAVQKDGGHGTVTTILWSNANDRNLYQFNENVPFADI